MIFFACKFKIMQQSFVGSDKIQKNCDSKRKICRVRLDIFLDPYEIVSIQFLKYFMSFTFHNEEDILTEYSFLAAAILTKHFKVLLKRSSKGPIKNLMPEFQLLDHIIF